ncbi:MAG: hypothetical protein K8I30_19035 [Anaerolineae bacterium]|nr:hypothetical protein [Anaerolineae bacterium]
MDDQEFLRAFESGALPPDAFPHRAHIRMAWLYLRRDGWDGGYENIRAGIRHCASAHGATRKYHETITRFWALLVFHAISLDSSITDFDAFLEQYPHLLNTQIITRHYSRDLLGSAAARSGRVEPDIEPLPADMAR